MPGLPARRPGAFLLLAAGLLLFVASQTAAILVRGDGAFTYALDDPYIHLALAEQLRAGTYGINPGEVSTPSSSVLWPFLLVPTAGLALTPLVLAVVATLLSAWLLVRLLDLVTDGAAARRPALSATVAAVPLLLLNWAGVAFTGMEHSAHVTASLAVGTGLVEVAVRERLPWWLVAGLVAGPLLRYEGLAVTVAGAAVLFWTGRRRIALAAGAAAVLPLAAFSAFAVANGLDLLPSSVLSKSDVADGSGSPVVAAASALGSAFAHPLFAVLTAGLLGHAALRRRLTPLHAYALAVLLAHALAGRFGWFTRYELYAYAAVLPVVAHLARRPLRAVFAERLGLAYVAVAAAVVAALAPDYVRNTARVAAAADNIHVQQAQLARFVAEHWRAPVAVHDIGLVAYDGGEYVVDLWGLASQEARQARTAGEDVEWMARLAEEHDAGLAMIYDDPDWFPEVPAGWTPVAVLRAEMEHVTVGDLEVTFFATSPSEVARLRAELRDFGPTLPHDAGLVLSEDGR